MTIERDEPASRQEVFLLIGRGGAILWSDASSSPVWLPDSRARWEAIWRHRDELEEIVHSHPVGPRGFSGEDETTMAALCAALGRRPRFSVVAPGGLYRRDYPPADADGNWPPPSDALVAPAAEPFWAGLLRLASGMTAQPCEPDSATDLQED
jgi:hypothetical protein